MEVCAEGYFKKIDKYNRIILVNLEQTSIEKLKNKRITNILLHKIGYSKNGPDVRV